MRGLREMPSKGRADVSVAIILGRVGLDRGVSGRGG